MSIFAKMKWLVARLLVALCLPVAVRAQEVFASLQDKKVMKKLKLCELRQCC